MPQTKASRLMAPEMSLAELLTVLAGYIDAIGFIKLKGIYVANMSGNSISVGLHAAGAHWSIVITRLWPIFSYVVGLVTARILVDLARTHGFHRTAAPPFLLEIACLFLFFRWHAGTRVFFSRPRQWAYRRRRSAVSMELPSTRLLSPDRW